MKLVEWDGSLCLGVGAMDDVHKKMISFFNDLVAASAAGVEARAFNAALKNLIDHTADHFHHEEAMMHEADYYDLAAHRAEHEVLLNSAMMLQKKAATEKSKAMNSYALSFLRSWLIGHILEADKKFAQFLLCPLADPARQGSGPGRAQVAVG